MDRLGAWPCFVGWRAGGIDRAACLHVLVRSSTQLTMRASGIRQSRAAKEWLADRARLTNEIRQAPSGHERRWWIVVAIRIRSGCECQRLGRSAVFGR